MNLQPFVNKMQQTAPLKYIGYARKSSEDNKERQAASLPDQLFIIEGIKSKQNLKAIDILQEAKSAHKAGREIFNSMLDRIEKGEANAIITWHPNRLCRNPLDAGRLIYLMIEKKLIEIRTPSRAYHDTPEDKFMLNIEFSMSQKDSDDKSEVVDRGLEKKCRDGWRPGEPPQGYLPDRLTESGNRKIYVDKERFPFVKKIFELFYNGTSVKEVYRIAKDEWHYTTRQRKRIGGKPLTVSMIYAILNNPFYTGRFEYPVGSGNWYDGKHEPMITQEMFDEIQVKLGNKSKYHLKHHEYAYTALMRCGYCNSGIVGEEKWQCICSNCKQKFSLTKNNKVKCSYCGTLIEKMAKPKILHYIHYRCGRKKRVDPLCKQRGLEVNKLEKQIDGMLNGIEISPLFMDWAIRQIQKMNENDRNFTEDAIEAVKKAHDDCRMRIRNLLQLKISPANSDGSLLSDEAYKAENDKLTQELKNIEKQLVSTDERMIQANSDTVKAFNFATRAKERFATDDPKVKRDIFMGLGSHLKLLDKTVQLDSPKYLFVVKQMKKEAPSIAERVAPELQSVRAKEMEALWASNSVLLRSRESHPA